MLRPTALFLAATFALALSSGLSIAQQSDSRYIDIPDNSGGNVMEMVRYRESLERSGKIVRIRGYCRSACTMLTTLPNACLGPKATIGFHAPRLPGTEIIPPYVDQIMGNYYRNGIRDRWFGGWNRSIDMHVISAQEYVRLDPQAKICDSIGKVRPKKR
ncbi:hypothetical protein [Paracoccus aminophilus]|uniref:Uncharacterized protein n=1 Tax=Paracoccus aminophilus JCM 7686 TaxID=1367847 RepID=S5YCD0_PARAH|nr:hypothetical protein [Paracoccus aminophilus]AGT09078.1 hypothetical protein JCM7686_1977 [Paracoccus aminophilus JCM 7686]